MSRLILVTGPGGAGSTTLAQATAEAIREEGATAELLPAADSLRERGAGAAARALGPVFGALGAEGLPYEAWSGLPGLSTAGLLLEAHDRLREVDAVVVDAGPLSSTRELVALPGTVERLLDAALTPALAMWRTSAGEDVVFSALSEARRLAVRLDRMLRDAGTSIRLVVPPGEGGVAVASRAVAAFAVLGVGVDGVIVNRFPRGSDDVPASERKSAARALEELSTEMQGIAVWKSTSRLRAAPKGRSALGPLGESPRLVEETLAVRSMDEALLLDVPLPRAAARRARIGVTQDRLVVEFEGVTGWVVLPAVLRRCMPLTAVRRADGIRVHFQPDPDLWMGGGAR